MGKLAIPKTGFPLKFKDIKLLQVGFPITNDLVPSIGSITHVKLLDDFLCPNSSPIT